MTKTEQASPFVIQPSGELTSLDNGEVICDFDGPGDQQSKVSVRRGSRTLARRLSVRKVASCGHSTLIVALDCLGGVWTFVL